MNDIDKSNRSRPVLKEGEWACVDAKCAFVNAETRKTCQKCGKAKPRAKQRVGKEIGKEAAEKSKGLFAAEDWVCSKCGNVNWARRHMCNICNAPKLADLEVRTGYGGGYMDREDVEYIQRDVDDEEFDEFGRKKRRSKREAGNSEKMVEDEYYQPETEEPSENQTKKEEEVKECGDIVKEEERHEKHEVNEYLEKDDDNEEEEEEEEEEDEGDEGDLDKYDLTADIELDSFKVNLEILRRKMATENNKVLKTSESVEKSDDLNSVGSTDCSCSCSGGECSCIESEEEEIESKRIRKRDEETASRVEIGSHQEKTRSSNGRDERQTREEPIESRKDRRQPYRDQRDNRSERNVGGSERDRGSDKYRSGERRRSRSRERERY